MILDTEVCDGESALTIKRNKGKPRPEALAKPVLLAADRTFSSMPSKQWCSLA